MPVSVQEYTSMLAEQDVRAEFVSLLGYLFSEAWTAATRTWATASSVPSAGSRATSAATRTPPPRVSVTAVRPPGMNRQSTMIRVRTRPASAPPARAAGRPAHLRRYPPADSRAEPPPHQAGGVVAEKRAERGQRDQAHDPRVSAACGRDAEGDHRGLAGQDRDQRVERGHEDRDEVRKPGS